MHKGKTHLRHPTVGDYRLDRGIVVERKSYADFDLSLTLADVYAALAYYSDHRVTYLDGASSADCGFIGPPSRVPRLRRGLAVAFFSPFFRMPPVAPAASVAADSPVS